MGIRLDEPLGQNDGTVKGSRVFECPSGHGVFTRGKNVTTGDFPERDILDELSDDDDNSPGGVHDHKHDNCSHDHPVDTNSSAHQDVLHNKEGVEGESSEDEL